MPNSGPRFSTQHGVLMQFKFTGGLKDLLCSGRRTASCDFLWKEEERWGAGPTYENTHADVASIYKCWLNKHLILQ